MPVQWQQEFPAHPPADGADAGGWEETLEIANGDRLADECRGLVRIPPIGERRTMERQVIRFRTLPILSALRRYFRRRRVPLRHAEGGMQ